MRLIADHAKVSVPGTTVDLGPAYEALGLALGISDEVTVRALAGSSQVRIIDRTGREDPEYWLENHQVERHLTVRALRRTLDVVGAPQVGISLTYRRGIPSGVGLGDREAQALGGIYAAWGLLGSPAAIEPAVLDEVGEGLGLSLLRLETAKQGGLIARLPGAVEQSEGGVGAARFLRLPTSERVDPVALIPGFTTEEEEAEGLLPRAVSFPRFAGNVARASALVPLLTGTVGGEEQRGSEEEQSLWRALVLEATADDVVQVHRRAFAPASISLVDWLRQRGYAAFLSGPGSAVVSMWPLLEAEQISATRSGWKVMRTGVSRAGLALDV